MYKMEDPLICLNRGAPEKSFYKKYVSDKITSFHEKELRTAAANNSKMKYLNINLYGLTGRCHPAISSNIITTDDVKMMRPHLKMLGGDYLTYQIKSQQSGGSPLCRLCRSDIDSISHIVYSCRELNRKTFFSEMKYLCSLSKNNINFDEILKSEESTTQLILDPCSFNLVNRVHLDDPIREDFFKLSRQICYSLDKQRRVKLKNLLNHQ